MKKIDLYIDFDGVILNTIKLAYKELEENNIDKKDTENARKYFYNMDWGHLLAIAEEINDSIEAIKYLIDSKRFNISILTHVISLNEASEKLNYLKNNLPRLNVIFVPKQFEKVDVVYADKAILIDDFSNNLKVWESDGGIGIKFSLEEEKDSKYPVISNLKDIISLLDNKIIKI